VTAHTGHEAAPVVTVPDRFHALDAARAFALLLGTVLHATMPRAARARGDDEALAAANEALPTDNEALAIGEVTRRFGSDRG
jgi:hypothetical protein